MQRLCAEGTEFSASAEKNIFAAAHHLERLLAYLPNERESLLSMRQKLKLDQRLNMRAQFHTLNVDGRPPRDVVAALSICGDQLSYRLLGQWLLAAGKPGPALPLLHFSLLGRRCNQPPVEEFLIARALIDLKKSDEAKRYYQAAVEWLEKGQRPLWACDLLAAGFVGPWQALSNLAGPVGDPRYNEFDWESWYECEVFRARCENKMRR